MQTWPQQMCLWAMASSTLNATRTFRTAAGFGCLWIYSSSALFPSCLTWDDWKIISLLSQVPLSSLIHNPKFQSGDIFQGGVGFGGGSFFMQFCNNGQKSFIAMFGSWAITFQSLTTCSWPWFQPFQLSVPGHTHPESLPHSSWWSQKYSWPEWICYISLTWRLMNSAGNLKQFTCRKM